jgi:hypothetical protein
MTNDPRFELLKSAPLDRWIALSEDESKIVAIGDSHSEVVSKSESAGVSDPVVMKTPKRWLPISV